MKKLAALSLVFYLMAGMPDVGYGAEKVPQARPGDLVSAIAGWGERLNNPRQEAPPWLDHLISFADYTFVLDDNRVKCLASFGLTVFPSDKFLQVPLLKDEISPESVVANGTVQDLTPIGGWLCFLPKEPGSYTLKVEFSLKPRILQGIRSISFTTPVSAVNRASFKSEKPWLVTSKRLPHLCQVGAAETTVPLLPGQKLDFRWEEVPTEVKRSPLFTVKPDIFYLFEGKDLHISARLATTIYTAPASSARLHIPSNAEKVLIHGPQVRRFTPEGKETVIDFKGEIEGKTDIFMSFSCPAGDGRELSWLPIPSIKGARISGGTMAISCPSDSDLMVDNVSQVEEIALYEIPGSLKALMKAQPVLAFRIRGNSPRLSVKPILLKPVALVEAVADSADFTSFRSPTGEEIVKVNLSVRNDRRQFLRVSLPEGANMIRCLVSGREVVLGRVGANGEILIPLERSIETLEGVVSFPVEFVYFTVTPPFVRKGSLHMELPSIDIPIARATWTAYIPEGVRTRRISGNMTFVKEFEEVAEMLEYGRGYLQPTPVTKPEPGVEKAPLLGDIPVLGRLFKKRLVKNYWLDANEAYRREDYEEAGRNLGIILEKYSESEFVKDARQLMDNIDLALRPPQVRKPAEVTRARAKGARRIQRQMEAQQFARQVEQRDLFTQAEEAEQKGEVVKSMRLLKKARAQSEVMLKRGARVLEQKAIISGISKKLESQEKILEENIRLNLEKRKLGEKLKEREEGEVVARRFESILADPAADMLQIVVEGRGEGAEAAAGGEPVVYKLGDAVREIKADVGGAANIALEQEVAGLRSRLSALEAAGGPPERKIDESKRRREAQIAAREVSRSIEAARPLLSLGKTELAARQVETVTSHYKERLGGGISGWAGVARQAEKFVEEARKKPADDTYAAGLTFVIEDKDADALGLTDEELTEGDRERFLEAFGANVDYRTAGSFNWAVDIKDAPAAEVKVSEGAVRFRGRQAGEALELLEEIGRQGGKTVNVSITSNRRIAAGDIAAVGGTVSRFANGYYAVLDQAQVDTLNEMRQPDASEPEPVQWPEFFVGNDAVMSNYERVRFARYDEKNNVLVLDNKEINLSPNQFLLVANRKGTSILGAGQAVGWGEAKREERVVERGFTLDVPGVGRVHLFEKLLLRAGEKPEILIEYEGKGGLI